MAGARKTVNRHGSLIELLCLLLYQRMDQGIMNSSRQIRIWRYGA